MCSWRSQRTPQLELKVSSDGENIRYSAYNHHPSFKCHWSNTASSPVDFMSVFAHCVWKGSRGPIESRLFSNGSMAILVSVIPKEKVIGIKEWAGNYSEKFLITSNPVVSAVNTENSLEFREEIREIPRSRSYDPEAEEGMTRWCRTPKGALVGTEEEPVTEETMKVWPGPCDIRLIKSVNKQGEGILCRVFNRENKENLVIRHRFALDTLQATPNFFDINFTADAIIQTMKKYTPEFENVENGEEIVFYRKHPLSCFMPGYVLCEVEALQVQRWVCEQFYRKKGESKKCFEYMNFVNAKKIVFPFGKGIQMKDKAKCSSEIEAWHIEIKRQSAWALQFLIGINKFFSGIFLEDAQNPATVDKKAMERLVQGGSLLDPERNKIVDDFAEELGACSTINFYIACDRSASQLGINGRAWIRNFAGAGRDIRGAVTHGATGLGHLFKILDLDVANRRVENATVFVEKTNRLTEGLQALRRRVLPF